MIFKKATFLLFAFLFLFFKLYAQNIDGIEIYVTADNMTSIDFHSAIRNVMPLQQSFPYEQKFLGNNTLYLLVSHPVKETYNLTVVEGDNKQQRTFKFIIKYKDKLEYNESVYDFTDLKQLENKRRELNTKKNVSNNEPPAVASQPPVVNSAPTQQTAPTQQNIQADAKNNSNIYNVIERADAARKAQQWNEAKDLYQQALQMQPDNDYAKNRLDEVNRSIQSVTDTRYYTAITNANNAYITNNFTEAIQYYNEALSIKTGDEYAKKQIDAIKLKLVALQAREDSVRKDSAFNSYIIAGDKALQSNLYDVASTAYKTAGEVKPANKLILQKLALVDEKKQKNQLLEQQRRNEDLYLSYINLGNKALENNSFDEAENAYRQADNLKSGNDQVKQKLNTIKAKRETKKAEAYKLYQDSVYSGFMDAANNKFNKEMYDSAIVYYKYALNVRPDDAVSKNKIQLINNIISTKAAEKNRKTDSTFQSYVLIGNNALNKKLYSDALIAYNEALKIKPDKSIEAKVNQLKADIAKDVRDEIKKDSIFYSSYIKIGDEALKREAFDTAYFAYQVAAGKKPGDAYALSQLEKIKVLKDKKQKELFAIDSVYNLNIVNAGNAFNKQLYDSAILYYSNALTARKNDIYAATQITLVKKKMYDIASAKDSLYQIFVHAADSSYKIDSFNNAKNQYSQALSIKPADSYATAQLEKADKALEAQTMLKADNLQVTEQKNNNVDNSKYQAVLNEINNNMIKIKASFFKMGNNVGATDEAPLHVVELDSFYISKYEVTQSQWEVIMDVNPSVFKCDKCPVENVSWEDAVSFIQKLNRISNKNYRLPSEAEWEFTAKTQNSKDKLETIAWYNENSKKKTHAVGSFKPNFLGVYDMLGNVEEWCNDWYEAGFYNKSDAMKNPLGPVNAKLKVIRGGSFYDMEGGLRPTVRFAEAPDVKKRTIGLRLAMNTNN